MTGVISYVSGISTSMMPYRREVFPLSPSSLPIGKGDNVFFFYHQQWHKMHDKTCQRVYGGGGGQNYSI